MKIKFSFSWIFWFGWSVSLAASVRNWYRNWRWSSAAAIFTAKWFEKITRTPDIWNYSGLLSARCPPAADYIHIIKLLVSQIGPRLSIKLKVSIVLGKLITGQVAVGTDRAREKDASISHPMCRFKQNQNVWWLMKCLFVCWLDRQTWNTASGAPSKILRTLCINITICLLALDNLNK